MAGDTTLTITGNAVDNPELRFTPQGVPVARFRIASTPRHYNKTTSTWEDNEPLFLTVSIWRQQAEHVCESITKGTRIIVTGRLQQRTYEKDGQKRTTYEIDAEDVAVSLKFATAKTTKAARTTAAQTGGQAQADPWTTAEPNGFTDQPPF